MNRAIPLPVLLCLLVCDAAVGAVAPAQKNAEAAKNEADQQQKKTEPKANYFLESYSLAQVKLESPPQTGEKNPLCRNLSQNTLLSAKQIVDYLGDRSPFKLLASGNRILIFSSQPKKDTVPPDLDALKTEIGNVAKLGRFSVELSIPHASALGDVGAKVKEMNYPDLDIETAGSGRIRVSSESAPDCAAWTAFLTSLRELAWRPYPVSPVDKVFYLNGSDVSAALNSATPASAVGSGTPDAKKTKAAPAAAKPDTTNGDDEADDSGPSGTADRAAADSKDSAKTPASGSDRSGAQTGAGPKSAGQDSAANGKSSDATKAPKKDTSSNSAEATPLPSASDLLVFSEPIPGDDAAVAEKRRIIAALDLPRPEMLVNVWSSQISSDDPNVVVEESQKLRELVTSHNESLQGAIFRAWYTIKTRAEVPRDFYDKAFYRYIVYRTVNDSTGPPGGGNDLQAAANAFLRRQDNAATLQKARRDKWGICDADKYCLGYTELFHPLKPRLTDLLIAVIAAQDPRNAATEALNAMEARTGTPSDDLAKSCESLDRDRSNVATGPPQFACFRRLQTAMFAPPPSGGTPYAVGQLRSAVADFLYHWKTAKQFPHEFSAYDLDQSAQTLNTALAPLIDAFNRDIATYQTILRERFDACLPKSSGKGFLNGGIVTVRTVSGKETIVDTATQSYLDASEAPTLAQLANSISQAAGGTFPPGVKGDITTSAILGAVNAMQPSEAKIGRGMKLDIMPRALAGATSAEIDVTLKVDETAEPALYTGGETSKVNDNTSRVAKHDTTTKIRVDSLKIVEVSSLWARLQRSRTKIPLIPPLVELPYIGTLVGIPRKPAAEYHSSSAVLSAVVIPTAADLAFSTRYEPDRIAVNTGSSEAPQVEFRSAVAFADLGPIRDYHRAITACFATGITTPVPQWDAPARTAPDDCDSLKFADLPGQGQ